MSSKAASDRKRKSPTSDEPEVVVSTDDQSKIKSKARRVSTDTQSATVASHQTTEESPTANAASVAAKQEDSIESIGQMIQDLFHSDNAKVDATLATLNEDLDKDEKKCQNIQAMGGCLAIVQLVKSCLDKVIARTPACDQVSDLNEIAELETLDESLGAIVSLTYHLDESTVVAIGGVEAVVTVMKTFPKCQVLQRSACLALGNLACCRIGKKKAVASGGLQLLLAAVNNHLDCDSICEYACFTLNKIIPDSKRNNELFISSGGVTTVAKVRKEWPDHDGIQEVVRKLMEPVVKELSCWTHAK
jgi:hypothetical protein